MISNDRNTPLLANWKCLVICAVVSMANLQYGFDTGAVAGFQAMTGFLQVFGYKDPTRPSGYNIHTKPQQLISSFLNVGTIIGTILTGPFASRFGRRPAIWAACVVSIVACAVQVSTTSLGGLYAGRIILGLSNGFFITFSNIYAVEASPPHLRGVLVSFFGFWVNIGSLLGSISDNYTKTRLNKLCYQIPLAALFAIPTLLAIFTIFVPESPRWLLLQGRETEARRSLERLRAGTLSPELLDEEFVEMQRGIEEEKELSSSASILDMFKGTDLRRTLLCVIAIASHAASGIWFIISYGTFFFQMADIANPFQASILSNVMGLVGAVFGMFLTQKVFGRRPMLMIGSAGCGACMLAIAVAYTVAPHSKSAGRALVGFSLMFNFFYNGFQGTVSWPVAGELVSSRLRVLTMGLSTGVNYFFNWLISYCTPYFLNSNDLNWGPKYGYIWAGSNLICLIVFFFFIPEMKGRSLEELDEMFQNRVPRREFPKYQCVSSERAKEIVGKHMDEIKEGGAVQIESV
ncbi:MFS transporter [Xylogone sp. PMI_703]|nr:MFS transporter [Xylogone sp. PMI_703]